MKDSGCGSRVSGEASMGGYWLKERATLGGHDDGRGGEEDDE